MIFLCTCTLIYYYRFPFYFGKPQVMVSTPENRTQYESPNRGANFLRLFYCQVENHCPILEYTMKKLILNKLVYITKMLPKKHFGILLLLS